MKKNLVLGLVVVLTVGLVVSGTAFAQEKKVRASLHASVSQTIGVDTVVAAFAGIAVVGDVVAIGIGVVGRVVRADVARVAAAVQVHDRLIFAGIGLSLRVNGQPLLNRAVFSALVVTVMLTTLAAPPLLKWSLPRSESTRYWSSIRVMLCGCTPLPI